MKKKVKLNLEKSSFYEFGDDDNLRDCKFLEKYFGKANSHLYFSDLNRLRNSANFYCNIHYRVNEISVLPIKFSYDTTFSALTEIDHTFEVNKNGEDAIRLELNGQYIGHFFPNLNCLIASDWVHFESLVEICDKLIDILVKEGFLKKQKEKKLPQIKVVLGGDPEFECLDQEFNVRSAGNYFGAYEGKIGRDGSGDQLELRPDPQESIVGLLKEFRKLIHQASEVCTISSEGNRYPLGGHLHISFQDEHNRIMSMNRSKSAEVLDDFLGFTADWSGKARGGYKSRRAYREQPHGFEYRTLPSTVWESPQILRIVAKLSQKLLFEAVNGGIEYEMIDKKAIPTKESYLKFISEREYDKLMNWPKLRPGHLVTKNWGKQIAAPKLRLSINFGDDWDTYIRQHIYDILSRLVTKNQYTITLYGINKKYGKVISNFKCFDFETKEMPYDSLPYHYGFPHEARVKNISIATTLTLALIENLKEKGIVE